MKAPSRAPCSRGKLLASGALNTVSLTANARLAAPRRILEEILHLHRPSCRLQGGVVGGHEAFHPKRPGRRTLISMPASLWAHRINCSCRRMRGAVPGSKMRTGCSQWLYPIKLSGLRTRHQRVHEARQRVLGYPARRRELAGDRLRLRRRRRRLSLAEARL